MIYFFNVCFLNNIKLSDEKVQLAGQMYDLVTRYLRRLDQETHKFKLELEANHSGITEILEKSRSYSYVLIDLIIKTLQLLFI